MNSGRESGPNQGAFWRDQEAGTSTAQVGRQETAMARLKKKLRETGRRHGLAEFSRLFRSMVDPYRPELHYMRGPGPKWRAKHMAPAAEAPVMHGLAHIER
jgi:hypothetical protein